MLSAKAVRYITNTSPLIGALLSILKKGRDFLAPFDKNRLSAASFSLRLCTSLSVLGGSRSVTTLTFKGLALIPCLVIRCPRNGPSSTPKEHFLRVKLHFDRPESFKGLLYIFHHILFGGTLDHHVVNVSLKISSNLIIEYLVYQSLVGSSGVLQTERHLLIAECSFSCKKGRFIEALHMHKAHKNHRALGFRALSLGAPRKGGYFFASGALGEIRSSIRAAHSNILIPWFLNKEEHTPRGSTCKRSTHLNCIELLEHRW
ncbi:hypothetical protein Tco_1155040 [Tanacetum coccineum]